MSNAGIFPGTNSGGWKNYVPLLRGVSSTGSGITQPILSDPRNTIGRYLLTNQGLVICQGQITFAAADTIGAGDSYYAISIPLPANRSSGGADLPLGQMFMWQGSAATPQLNMIGLATLADPGFPAVSGGQEDSFIQGFISRYLAFGTATFASSGTSVTVTHGMSQTPNAYDFHLTPTNTPSSNPQWIDVQNIGATTFDLVLKASSTTTPATVSWKIEAEPNAAVRMNSAAPWAWAAGHSIGWNIQYEARR